MEIIPYQPSFKSDVLGLIVSIQRDEFAIEITAAQQPDLDDVSSFYQVGMGNFWVAVVDGRVVGTISLLDIGHHQGALRKMFVHREFRGRRTGTAGRLLETLLEWAQDKAVRELFLGTTSKFVAAHRFYEKNGFLEVDRSALPPAFPIMSVDTTFFRRAL
jgi:N-acetylglutamate synthase-like GNAT family acetyltransferase